MRALTAPRSSGWRRESFLDATAIDPNSRLTTPVVAVGEYERVSVAGGIATFGVANNYAEEGFPRFKPLLSPTGQHLRWSEVASVRIRVRWVTAGRSLTDGLYVAVGIGDASTTLTGKEFFGGGPQFSTSTVNLRYYLGTFSATSGAAATIAAVDNAFVIIPDTTANLTRIYGDYISGVNVSAERVALNAAVNGSERPTGLAYMFLTVGRIDGTAGTAVIDLAVESDVGESPGSWLAVATR